MTSNTAQTQGLARRAWRAIRYHVPNAALAGMFLFPLVWTVASSLKTQREANASPPQWIPTSVSFENYSNLANYGAGLGTYIANSLIVSAITVALTLALSALAGYGFARFNFPGKSLSFLAIIAIMMVPYATLILALYKLLALIGLHNSLLGLALVLTVFQLPFSVFLMRNSFESIPRELEEAALVDGCSNLGTFRRISLPIATPAIVTVALFAFLNSWNEYLAPLILLNNGDMFTLPVAIVTIRSGAYGSIDWGGLQAGITVAMIPSLILYLLLQRFYVRGMLSGAMRG